PDACQGPDGMIYVTHDHDRGGKAEVWFHRFTEEDILAKRIVSPKGRLNVLVSRGMASKANGKKAK
ncbi:MAG: exo-alpha-sialidase, partial [bacterium]|nr:exo-alpha-sialidase [Candidatus Colisoma equi]